MEQWKRAPDIKERLEEIQAILGITQAELGQRAGVWPAQANNWMTGKQKPTKRRLEDWAAREGWDLEVFKAGGRRPAEFVNSPVNVLSGTGASQVREERGEAPYGPSAPELLAWAQQAQNAIGQVVRLLQPSEPAATDAGKIQQSAKRAGQVQGRQPAADRKGKGAA